MRRSWWLLALGCGGCNLFSNAADAVQGALDPTVAVGIVAFVEAPSSDEYDLASLP